MRVREARPGRRDEQQFAQALAQRVFAHERLQLTDQLGLPTFLLGGAILSSAA